MSTCSDPPKQHECVKKRISDEGGKPRDERGESRDHCCKKVEPRESKFDREGKLQTSEGLFKELNYYKFLDLCGGDPLLRRFKRTFTAGVTGLMASYLIGGYVYQMQLKRKRAEEWEKRREKEQERRSGLEDLVEDATNSNISVGNDIGIAGPCQAESFDLLDKDTISNDKVNNVSWKMMRGKATHMVAIIEKEGAATADGSNPSVELEIGIDKSSPGTGSVYTSEDVFLKYAEGKAKRKVEARPKGPRTSSWS